MRRTTTTRRAVALTCALALTAGACSDDTDQGAAAADGPASAGGTTPTQAPAAGEELAWPVPDWQPVSAADAGMDQAALDAMAADAEAAGSNCLVVTRDGQLVGEWYWNGWDPTSEQEIFSATKSITSTLVGLAVDDGLLALDDPASTYIPEWVGTPSEAVTVRNLVSNDSGRYQDFQSDYVTMAVQEPDKTGYSIGLSQQHEIGTQWVYNNAAIQTLDQVLEAATGMPTHEYAAQELFGPLGMETEIATDDAGNTLTFMGGQASCRDLARFGLLFLRDGQWDGEQLLSSEWVDEATHPSQDLNPNYGFLWWLFGDRAGTPAGEGGEGTVPPAPEGSGFYAALGLGNQIVGVFPESGVVVTRIGTQKGLGGSEAGGEQFSIAHAAVGVQRALGNDVDADDLGLGESGVATGG